DHGVTPLPGNLESHQHRDGAGRWDFRRLQLLQPDKFRHRRASAKQPAEAIAQAMLRIKFQVIRAFVVLEPPDLAIVAVFNERPDAREITEGLFDAGNGHGGSIAVW